MIRVVIDSNLFISYLISNRLIKLDALLTNPQKVRIITCQQQLEEIARVGKKENLKKYFSPRDVKRLFDNIHAVAEIIEIRSQVTVCRDKKDNFLLSLSKDGKANYLVSGDEDLLVLKKFGKTDILKIADFLKRIE